MNIPTITIHPIGIVHSPYKQPKDVPIQSRFNTAIQATIEIYPQYMQGLKDLDEFSHAIVLFHFHQSQKETLRSRPYLEDVEHGVFSIRSPHRPNHIGLSIISIQSIQDNIIHFKDVDMTDKTPVIDIKPYVSHFDTREQTKSGWVEKHFDKGTIPSKAIHHQ